MRLKLKTTEVVSLVTVTGVFIVMTPMILSLLSQTLPVAPFENGLRVNAVSVRKASMVPSGTAAPVKPEPQSVASESAKFVKVSTASTPTAPTVLSMVVKTAVLAQVPAVG